jgi:tetratricopeptide (TPR) repeat protein
MSRRLSSLFALVALAIAASSCASSGADRASRAAATAAREESTLRQSASVERDPALNAYARQVLCKVAAEQCGSIRLYIVRSPDFGARTLTNGTIEIGVGLLWRSANESQLAFVLARQAAHLAEAHPDQASAAEARLDHVRIALGAISLIAPPYADDVLQLGVNGVGLRGESGRERTADGLALERLTAAGYDPAEAVALSYALAAEAREGRHVPPSLRDGADLNRAAPTSRSRLRAIAREGAATGSTPEYARALRERIRPFLAQWLEADLQRRDYDASLYAFARLAGSGVDLGLAHYALGQAHRLRREDGDLERAREAYRLAVSYPDAPAVAWRELGDAEARAGDAAAAVAAFSEYLQRARDASDRFLIEARIAELQAP